MIQHAVFRPSSFLLLGKPDEEAPLSQVEELLERLDPQDGGGRNVGSTRRETQTELADGRLKPLNLLYHSLREGNQLTPVEDAGHSHIKPQSEGKVNNVRTLPAD